MQFPFHALEKLQGFVEDLIFLASKLLEIALLVVLSDRRHRIVVIENSKLLTPL